VPTYEYRCKACGQELEVVQSFTDDALTTCEACGGQLRKVFGNVGIAFKGSGFYKNDSRGKAKTAASTSPDKSSDAGSSSSDNGSSDNGSSGAGKEAAATSKPDSPSTSSPAAPAKADKAKSSSTTA
jgi:putative FmdB family regulatory protein